MCEAVLWWQLKTTGAIAKTCLTADQLMGESFHSPAGFDWLSGGRNRVERGPPNQCKAIRWGRQGTSHLNHTAQGLWYRLAPISIPESPIETGLLTRPGKQPSGEDRIRTCGRELPLHRFSKPALSTTQPPLRIVPILPNPSENAKTAFGKVAEG